MQSLVVMSLEAAHKNKPIEEAHLSQRYRATLYVSWNLVVQRNCTYLTCSQQNPSVIVRSVIVRSVRCLGLHCPVLQCPSMRIRPSKSIVHFQRSPAIAYLICGAVVDKRTCPFWMQSVHRRTKSEKVTRLRWRSRIIVSTKKPYIITSISHDELPRRFARTDFRAGNGNRLREESDISMKPMNTQQRTSRIELRRVRRLAAYVLAGTKRQKKCFAWAYYESSFSSRILFSFCFFLYISTQIFLFLFYTAHTSFSFQFNSVSSLSQVSQTASRRKSVSFRTQALSLKEHVIRNDLNIELFWPQLNR